MLLLITHDDFLAEALGERFLKWGFTYERQRVVHEAADSFGPASVVLLDVREKGGEIIEQFRRASLVDGRPRLLLLNRAGNIPVSRAGMRAGAVDEITEPFCSEMLKKKLLEAGELGTQPQKKGLFAAFSAAMAAAAMAHGGEFEAAIEMIKDNDAPPRPGQGDRTMQSKPEDSDG